MVLCAVLFDAAETLFTTRGSVGQIYGSVARQYGSTASDDAIQAAFARQFRGAGPLSVQDQKRWWKDVVYRVFSEVGMVDDFEKFFDQLYDRFRDSEGWVLFPETTEVLTELKNRRVKLGVISNFDNRAYYGDAQSRNPAIFRRRDAFERNRILQTASRDFRFRRPCTRGA